MTEEGQAAPIVGTRHYDYQYFLGDNLGNTRESFGTKNGFAQQYQKDDYYPFGMEISNYISGPKNYYLYNKKELQNEFNENDYGARFYDSVIARWTSVDPMAEVSRRWSTYNYVENDPIRLTDPDGMTPEDDEWLAGVIAQDIQQGIALSKQGRPGSDQGNQKSDDPIAMHITTSTVDVKSTATHSFWHTLCHFSKKLGDDIAQLVSPQKDSPIPGGESEVCHDCGPGLDARFNPNGTNPDPKPIDVSDVFSACSLFKTGASLNHN
jgi:RHS repeat-associated protein